MSNQNSQIYHDYKNTNYNMRNKEGLEEYFSNISKFSRTWQTSELIKYTNAEISMEILSGEQHIAKQSIPFQIQESYKNKQWLHVESIDMQNKLRGVQNRKNKMKKKLEDLMSQQNDINIDLSVSHVRQKRLLSESRAKKPERSELTEQEKQNIKKILKRNRQYERQLSGKTQKFYENIRKSEKSREIQAKKQQQSKKNQRKKDLRKSKIERQNNKENKQALERKWLKAIKQIQCGKKKLYEQVIDDWRLKQNQQESRKIEVLKQIRKLKSTNFDEIKEHQKKYNQILKQQKQSRSKIALSSVSTTENARIYNSSFLTAIMQNQLLRKREEKLKEDEVRNLIEKRNSYGENVRMNHLPKLKLPLLAQSRVGQSQDKSNQNKKQRDNKQQIQMINSKSLTLFQMHSKGVSYLREANALAAKNNKNKQNSTIQQQNENTFIKHRNYLAEERVKRGETNQKGSDLDQIQRIMKFRTLPDDVKFYKAKVLAEKIEKKDYYPKSKVLVDSINAKLEILRQFSS